MDLSKIESKWQEKWRSKKAFESKVEHTKKKFFFTVPYPYISGSAHIGHGRATTEGDIYCRYKRMSGFNVLYPLSFHITGTPVLGISAAIASGDKKKIELYRNYVKNYIEDESEIKKVINSFKDPQKIVDFFIPKMIDEMSSLGLSIDWRRSFTSGDIEHQKMVEWQFNKYKDKNFLVQGSLPILFCVRDKNAVGEDDIQGGDSNPVGKQEFVLLKFKRDNGEFLVAGTLRPETMFGQTNLWVAPGVEYLRVQVGKEVWILSTEGTDKLSYQRKDLKIIGKIKGSELIGEYVEAPKVKKKIIILPSEFNDTDIVSGIVTSVPSDAPYDYIALEDLKKDKKKIERYGLNYQEIQKIEVVPIIETEKFGDFAAKSMSQKMGIKNQNDPKLEAATHEVYKEGYHKGKLVKNCGKYNGKPVSKVKELIKNELIKSGDAIIFHEVTRPAICRCGGKVIVSILDDQWFINFNAKGWKDLAYKCLKGIEIVPELYRKNFEDTFEWLDKRPVARRRGLGTQFPFDKEWIIESLSDSTIYMSLYTINHLIKEFNLTGDQLTLDFFNFVYLGKGDIKDVSKSTDISEDHLKKIKESFEYWYPNDHRHTFINHLSNHLSFFIFAHSAIFPKKYWPTKISFHGLVMSEGQKMSKSLGNTVSLLDVKHLFGADVFRAYISTVTTTIGTFDWRSEEVDSMKRHLKSLYNTLFSMQRAKIKDVSNSSKAFLSKFESSIKTATEAIDKMKLREYGNIALYDILNAYKRLQKRASEQEMAGVNDLIVERWIKLLCPVIPHLAEEMWESIGKKDFVSLEKWPSYDESKIDKTLEQSDEIVSTIIADISEIRKITGKEPDRIKIFVASSWKRKMVEMIGSSFKKGIRDLKDILSELMADDELKKHGKDISKIVPKLLRDVSKIPELVLDAETERDIILESKDFFKEEFKAEIEVIEEKNSKESKARQAFPGKPALLFD